MLHKPQDFIQQALDASDSETAYTALLAAWRQERSATVSALLRQLGDHAADRDGPVFPGLADGSDPGPAHQSRLADLLAADRPIDTRRLAEAAFQLPSENGIDLWGALQSRLPDPNATAVLVEVLASHPSRWMAPACAPFWGEALGWIEVGADRTVLPGLDAAAHAMRNAGEARFPLDTALARRIQDLQTAIRTRLELAPPTEDPQVRGWLDREQPRAVSPALWLACTTHPEDPHPREVLRDALLEADDPRGAALATPSLPWRRYHARWVEALAPVLDLPACRFEGPFLIDATLDSDATPTPWIGLREWRTVETVDGTAWPGCEALFVGRGARPWPVLRTLIGVTGAALQTDHLPALRHFEERLHTEALALQDIRQPLHTLVLGATAQHRAGTLDPKAPVFDTLELLVLKRGHHRWLDALPAWLDQIPARCAVELPPSFGDLQLPWHVVMPARPQRLTIELGWFSALPPSPSQLSAVLPLLRAASDWRLVRGPASIERALSTALTGS